MTLRRFIAAIFGIVLTIGTARAAEPLDPAALAKDAAIAERAYRTLHPALTRYRSAAEIDKAFAAMREALPKARTQAEAYITFSKFLAEVQCGHTYANFYNHSKRAKADLFDRADKLPLTFDIIGTRMIVTKNVSADKRLTAGDEIVAIDGRPAEALLGDVVALTKGDGGRPEPRLYQLQVSGLGQFEPFDIYFPLLFPPTDGAYTVTVKDGETDERYETRLETVTRKARLDLLIDRYGPQATSVDDLWSFEIKEPGIAYLRLGSFVTWRMKMDWRAFLKDAFKEIKAKGLRQLIIDVRGNAGGDNDVLSALFQHIASKTLVNEPTRELLRYQKVPDDLRPYLSTWDKSFYDRTGKVKSAGDGFYTWIKADQPPSILPAQKGAYDGAVQLLIDAGNSSATFTLATVLKNNKRATLIGQETGGNRKGITGGQFFFLTLPHSQIAGDIPLVGYYPDGDQPDSGIKPDVPVALTIEDIRSGRDATLEKAMTLARKSGI